MTVSDKKKIYDCTTCPYPRYKDGSVIFCDVCIKKILDEQNEKKRRKEQPDGDRKSTRLNSSHGDESRMPSSA